jgi:hypothetical protein
LSFRSNKASVDVVKARQFPMVTENKKGFWRAFLDFFILFSGVSTASNLTRTQGRPVRYRGMFLFRKPASRPEDRTPDSK